MARRIPLVVGLHGSDVFMAEKAPMRRLVAAVLRRTRRLTACSPELAHRVEAIGFDGARSHVIPYGVDVELFRPDPQRRAAERRRLGIPEEAVMALGVGRMATKKGFHVLIGALAELFATAPDLRIVLAGAGDRLEELRRDCARWGDRVLFPGAVLHDTLPDLYRAADLFVLPAVHDAKGNVDGLPNVILEAMASGLPGGRERDLGNPARGDRTRATACWSPKGRAASCAARARRRSPSTPAAAPPWARPPAAAPNADLTWDAIATRYRAAYLAALA